jgi:hypothetical protein
VIATLDTRENHQVDLAGGRLEVDPGKGEIRFSLGAGDLAVPAPRVAADPTLYAWTNGEWFAVVGSAAPDLVIGVPEEHRMQIVGQLDRLDFEGGYDPGGLYRVTFVEVEENDVLVLHEFGAARLSRDRGLIWQRTHRDVMARGLVEGDRVAFQSEWGSFAYRLSDGGDAG